MIAGSSHSQAPFVARITGVSQANRVSMVAGRGYPPSTRRRCGSACTNKSGCFWRFVYGAGLRGRESEGSAFSAAHARDELLCDAEVFASVRPKESRRGPSATVCEESTLRALLRVRPRTRLLRAEGVQGERGRNCNCPVFSDLYFRFQVRRQWVRSGRCCNAIFSSVASLSATLSFPKFGIAQIASTAALSSS